MSSIGATSAQALAVQGTTHQEAAPLLSEPPPAADPAPTGPAASAPEADAPSPADPTASAPPIEPEVNAPAGGPPARLQVPVLGIDAPVVPVGVDQDGQLEVPDDVAAAGWYRFGPAPGGSGSAVLVGHVDDYRQGVGVLARIGDLNPGDEIEVIDADGRAIPFQVVAREQWAKADVPLDRLFDRGGSPRLVLITCGGAFDSDLLSYTDNIVVTAAPVR